jgi:quercetin dioxygenase-like cupin family protein
MKPAVDRPLHPSTTTSTVYAPGNGSREVWLPWHIVGRAAVKATAADTEGRFSQIEFDDSRGTSPPLHVHHNGDESFYVIEGDIEVVCDGRRMAATSGDFVLIPRGQAHSYVVMSERARLLTTFAPAGVEDFFVTQGVPVVPGEPPPPPVEPDPEELAPIVERYAFEIVGPPLALPTRRQ